MSKGIQGIVLLKELIIAIIEKTIGPLSMMDGGPIQAKDRVCKFQRELKPGTCER